MPKLPPLPSEFRAIRDNPDLTEDEKIDAVWDLLAQRGTPIIRPPDIPEEEIDPSNHRERTFYQARRGKDGKLRLVAFEPEICRLIIRHVFLHATRGLTALRRQTRRSPNLTSPVTSVIVTTGRKRIGCCVYLAP
jgi:hypothetical protein